MGTAVPSNVRLRSDGKASPIAESFGRNLQSRSSLLALVFAALHHANHLANQFPIKTAIAGNLLRRMGILYVVFEDGIEDFVRRQAVAIFLVGTQLRRRRLIHRASWYDRLARIRIA